VKQRHWFKVWHRDLLSDPDWAKLHMVERAVVLHAWCLAAREGKRGGTFKLADLLTLGDQVSSVIEKLCAQNWLHVGRASGQLYVPNWRRRQESDSAHRVRKHRELQQKRGRNPAACNDNVTAHVTGIREGEGEGEGDKKKKPPIVPLEGDEPKGFSDFWKAYPRKVGKGAARKAWIKAKGRPPLDKLLAAVESQKAAGHLPIAPVGGKWFCPHPATWLNQGRWDDEPQLPLDLKAQRDREVREAIAAAREEDARKPS
jgi:hypothetical protein